MANEFYKPDIDYRVTMRNSTALSEYITFEATPDLIETHNVNYKMIDPVHAPGQIAAYVNSSSRTFNISNVKLISRTPVEAAMTIQRLWLLRAWTKPSFGTSTLTSAQREKRDDFKEKGNTLDEYLKDTGSSIEDFGVERKGEPPAVLLLSAYSRDSTAGNLLGNKKNSFSGHINRVPVIITSLSIPYPSDVDYIPAEGSSIPVPTIMTIDMSLVETHSPFEYEKFSLTQYKTGTLAGF